MDDNIDIARVILALSHVGRPCKFDEVKPLMGTNKPKKTLLSILKQSDRISVCNEGRMSIVPPPSSAEDPHPIKESSKTKIVRLFNQLKESFPSSKKNLKTAFQKVFGGVSSSDDLDLFLSDMLYFGYASSKGGKLSWNIGRIKDLHQRQTNNAVSVQGQYTLPGLLLQTAQDFSRPNNNNDVAEWGVTSGKKVWEIVDGVTCFYIDNLQMLQDVIGSDPIFSAQHSQTEFVALDCEGVPDSLELVQIAYSSRIYVFDGQLIGIEKLCRSLKPLLTSTHITKVIHDLHQDALALELHGNVQIANVLDTQLLAEYHFSLFSAGFNQFLENLDTPLHPSKDFMKGKMGSSRDYWNKRPLARSDIEYAAMDAYCLARAIEKFCNFPQSQLSLLKSASQERAASSISNKGHRTICFDSSKNHRMASTELLRLVKPSVAVFGSIHEVECEVSDVIDILPLRFKERFPRSDNSERETDLINVNKIRDINLDIARRPLCWVGSKREFLCSDPALTVTEEDIEEVVQELGEIGHDNRAGLTGKMHRFSVMRARDESITGLTIRIGRNITGLAELLMDIVLGSDKSILFMGEPGSGKTTVVREVTRLVAEEQNVVVVDTSNEIGGDGMQPHKSIGYARRMMVQSLDLQSKVMIECVQNHTPSCMVIDEIGRPKESEAARTVKNRGVRIIASAHGDLRKLVGNKELNGLIGGLETVTMGDEMAKEEGKRKLKNRQDVDDDKPAPSGFVNKSKTQRRSDPTFDIIVELGPRGQFLNWNVVKNVAHAVDCILDGRKYNVEKRYQDCATGAMFVQYMRN